MAGLCGYLEAAGHGRGDGGLDFWGKNDESRALSLREEGTRPFRWQYIASVGPSPAFRSIGISHILMTGRLLSI